MNRRFHYSAATAATAEASVAGEAVFGFPGFLTASGPRSARCFIPALMSLTSHPFRPASKASLPINAWASRSSSARCWASWSALSSRALRFAMGFWARGIRVSLDSLSKESTRPPTRRNGIQLSPTGLSRIHPHREDQLQRSIRRRGAPRRVEIIYKPTPCLITHDALPAASRFLKFFQAVKAPVCFEAVRTRPVTNPDDPHRNQRTNCHQSGDVCHRVSNTVDSSDRHMFLSIASKQRRSAC